MNAFRTSPLSRRQVLAAVVALALGVTAVMFAAGDAGGDASARALPSQATLPLPPPVDTAAASAPAGSGIHAAVGGAASAPAEAPAAVDDPFDGVILEAVDPAEALFGEQPPVATTN